MAPQRLVAALSELDAGSRALLDLSLRLGIDDDEIADLLRTDRDSVVRSRNEVIEQMARRLGAEGPGASATVEDELRAMAPEEWPEEDGGPAPAPAPATAIREEPEVEEEEGAEAGAEAEREEPPPTLVAPPRERTPDRPLGSREAEDGPVWGQDAGEVVAFRRRVLALVAAIAVAIAIVVWVAVSDDEEDLPSGPDVALDRGERGEGGGQGSGRDRAGERQGGDGDRGGRRQGDEEGAAGGAGGAATSAEGVTLKPLPGFDGGGRATASLSGAAEGSDLELTVAGLPEPDGAYEVWLYDSLTDSESVGRFSSGRATLQEELPADATGFRYLDVSLEPSDGNPGHGGASVLRVPIDELLDGS